jgi:hypothetical protein
MRNIPQIIVMFTEVLWSTEAPLVCWTKRVTASKTGKAVQQVLPRSGRLVAAEMLQRAVSIVH